MAAVSEFHAEAQQTTASEGLAQSPYVAARAGFEPRTPWTRGDASTNEPPRSTYTRWIGSLATTYFRATL